MRSRTAQEIAEAYAQQNPTHQFAYDNKGYNVGILQADGTYHALASLTILDAWVGAPQILVNGARPLRTWIPVT